MPEEPHPKHARHPWQDRGVCDAAAGVGDRTRIFEDASLASGARPERIRPRRWGELVVVSNHTFLEGASHPEELVRAAAALGHAGMALTDAETFGGSVRAHIAARELGSFSALKGVVPMPGTTPGAVGGVGFRLAHGTCVRLDIADPMDGYASHAIASEAHASRSGRGRDSVRALAERTLEIALYASDRASWGLLCRLLTRARARSATVALEELHGAHRAHDAAFAGAACAEDAPRAKMAEPWQRRVPLRIHDLVELMTSHPGGASLLGVILPPALPNQRFLEAAAGLARFMRERMAVLLVRDETRGGVARAERACDLADALGVSVAAGSGVHMHSERRRPLLDTLACIREGVGIDRAAAMLAWNAERRLRPVAEIERRFADRPEALETAWRFIDRAAGFTLDELRYEYPDEVVPSGVTPMQHLRDLVWRGARERYPRGVPAKVARQFEHEFAIIDDLRYAPYFLTVHDIVAFARGRGILCQGRGAAANSAVCFALGVTAVDPDRIDVLFERFVSRERNEPPDIDIDFEHERREEVIQHIYRKYGRHRAALVCEVISYRGRSAVRDVGKALGFTPDAIGRLAGSIDRWSGGGLGHRDDPSGAAREESLRAAGLDPSAPRVRQLVALVGEILGFPRHRSQHVGGFIISRGALGEMVPIEHAAMEDRSIIEWDKDDIEALGMLKIDILSLGMLTAIRKTIDLVNGDRAALADGADGASPSDASKPRRDLVMAGVIGAGARHSGSVEADARVAPAPASAPASAHILASHEVDRPAARPIGSGSPASSSPASSSPASSSPASSSPASSSPASSSPASFPSSSIGAPCAGDGPMRSADRSRREVLRFHAIPPEDPSTYDMICIADTIGVFQIESRAQMSMLPRLRPRSFYDLVVEVAIVRPGPIQGDMVHPYLRRRSGEEPVRYPNDAIRKVLGKTLGVPLFQEQAMALAVVAAGFTPGQADELRRAIAAWKRSGNQIARFGEALEEGMVARGYSRTFAKQVFEQIKGFSGYGFPESHAASFALLVYASAWLKRHHPAAFAAALLNSQPMGFYAPAQIVRDAKEHGVAVRGIDIHCSRWDSTLERGPDVGPALADEARRACGGVQQTFAWSSCDGSGAADAARGRAPSPSVEGSARSRMSRSSTVRIDAGLGASLAAIARREQRDAACDELPDEPPDKPPDESRDQSPPAECVASINAATASDAADPAEMHLLERFRWSGASDEADSCFRGVRIQRWERMDADSRSTSVRRDLALERLHGRGRSVTVGGDEGDLSPIRAAEPLAPPSPSPSSHDFASHTSPARMRTLPSSQTVGAESESEFEFEFESEGPPAIAAEPVRDDPARFAVPTQPALRLGLRLVRGLTAEEAQRIVEAVARAGPFRRIADLADSARIGRSTLRKLAAADAFGSMGLDRQQANWQILAWREQTCEADGAPAPSLWSGPARAGSETETIEPALPEVAELSAIAQDLEATGISLKRHPIACLRDRLQRARAIPCGFLREETRTPDRKIVVVAGIVLIRQRPSTAKGIVFMTIEDETGVANLVIRPRVYERLRGVLRHAAAVCVRGRVERRHGVVHVLVGAGRDITRRLEVDPDAGSVRPMDARPSPGASGQGVISEGTGAPRGGGLPKTVDPSGNHVDHVDHVDHVRGTGVRATDDALLAHDDAPRAPGRTGAFRRSRDFH